MEKKVFLGETAVTYNKAEERKVYQIRSSNDAHKLLRELIGDMLYHQEVFCAMYLTKSNQVMWTEIVNVGTHTSCQVDVKAIVKRALVGGCNAVILGHNHPSGNKTPSQADRVMTSKLKDAFKYFDLTVLDHIIVVEDGYYSFADNGERSLS